MITKEQIEELGLAVADAKSRLAIATENLNDTLIKYWHQETGAKAGDKFLFEGKDKVVLGGFFVKNNRMSVALFKTKMNGCASRVEKWNHIGSIAEFKKSLTKI